MDSDQQSEEQTQSDSFQQSSKAGPFTTSNQDFTTECDKQCEEQEEIKAPIQEIRALKQEIESKRQFGWDLKELQFRLEFLETREDDEVLEPAETDQYIEEAKVILNPLGEFGDVSIDSVEIRLPDFRRIAMDCLGTPTVQKLFAELPVKLTDFGMVSIEFSEFPIAPKVFVEMSSWVESLVLTARIECCYDGVLKDIRELVPYDRGKKMMLPCCGIFHSWIAHLSITDVTLVFDPGGGVDDQDCEFAIIVKHRVLDGNVIFDPGIYEICVGLSNFFKVVVHTNLKKDSELSMLGLNGFDSSLIANARCCYLGRVKGIRVAMSFDRGKVLDKCGVKKLEFKSENELFLPCLGSSTDSWTYFNIGDEGYYCYLELARPDNTSFPYDRGRFWVAQVEKMGLSGIVFDLGGGCDSTVCAGLMGNSSNWHIIVFAVGRANRHDDRLECQLISDQIGCLHWSG